MICVNINDPTVMSINKLLIDKILKMMPLLQGTPIEEASKNVYCLTFLKKFNIEKLY